MTKKYFLLIAFIGLNFLFAQNKNGGIFKFDKFKFQTKNFYKDIPQKEIKAVRLSVRVLSDTVINNQFLFYPYQQSGNRIGLFDLIIWAINNHNLKIYSPKIPDFEELISIDSVYEIVRQSNRYETYNYEQQTLDSNKTFTLNGSSIKKFYLLESTIIGNDDKIITIRPIGLCPIFNDTLTIFESEKTEYNIWERPLFWVYFPDLMPVLANHSSETETNGINNTLDFFLKNYYKGELDKYMHFDFSKMDLDVSLEAKGINKDGYNVEWILNNTNEGMFINPNEKKFQGNPEIKSTMPMFNFKEQSLPISEIYSAKYIFKTIDLRNVENYPLHFPYESNFGQSSLIDLLINGVRNKTISAYKNSESYQPIQLSELDEVMKNSVFVPIIDDDGNIYNDSVIIEKIPNYDVCKYLLKEVEFYDLAGKLIGSRIIGISPIVKHVSTQTIYSDYTEPVYLPVFFVSFADSAVRNLLNQNFTYRFSKNDNSTFYSFFKEDKYKTDTTNWKVDASIYTAFWELKLSPVNYLFPFKSKNNQLFEEKSIGNSQDSTLNLSEIACAKYKTISIHLDDPKNASLKQSMTSYGDTNCFIELIMDAVKKGEIKAYSQNKTINYSQAVELMSCYIGNSLENVDYDIPRVDSLFINNPKTTVTMYDVKVAVFYNSNGDEIGSKIVGFYPINQYIRSEISECGFVTQEEIKSPAFYIPFDFSTQKFLSEHNAYEFKNGIKISYLSFFIQKLYSVKYDIFQVVGINNALGECGISPVKLNRCLVNDSAIQIPFDANPKIVIREVGYDNSLNYQLFSSDFVHYGMYTFSESVFEALQNKSLKAFKYNIDGKFEENIDLKEVNEHIINLQRNLFNLGLDYTFLPDSAILNFDNISKFLFKELHVGGQVFVIGVCPVMRYEAEPELFMENALCWVPFNSTFQKAMNEQEIFRTNCEPEITIGEYFFKNKYYGKIISEQNITKTEAEKILNDLKN